VRPPLRRSVAWARTGSTWATHDWCGLRCFLRRPRRDLGAADPTGCLLAREGRGGLSPGLRLKIDQLTTNLPTDSIRRKIRANRFFDLPVALVGNLVFERKRIYSWLKAYFIDTDHTSSNIISRDPWTGQANLDQEITSCTRLSPRCCRPLSPSASRRREQGTTPPGHKDGLRTTSTMPLHTRRSPP
jgi:hypothetical protein